MGYMPGDRVRYLGSKLTAHFNEKKVKRGEVVARVKNVDDEYVVEFGEDSYVMNEKHLAPWQASKQELHEAETLDVMRRRKRDEDE